MPKPRSAARVLWKSARTLESGFRVSLPVAESLAAHYCHPHCDREEAIGAAHRQMRQRDARAEPSLPSMFPHGELSMWARKAKPFMIPERIVIFTGKLLHASDIDDDAVQILFNLVSEIGRILEQEEVHLPYRDRTWTLKAGDEMATPWGLLWRVRLSCGVFD